MKKAKHFSKSSTSGCSLAFACLFCKFQPGVAYKNKSCSYQITDHAVMNLQNKGFEESHEDEEEKDHSIDDEEEEVIYLDWTVLLKVVYFLIYFFGYRY